MANLYSRPFGLELFASIVDKAAEQARAEMKSQPWLAGCEPFRLFYKVGALVVTFADATAEGYTATGRELPPSTPYHRYAAWIEANSRDLPILGGGAQ